MLDNAKSLVNRSDSLWWRDLNLVGVMEEEDCNWFSNNISCKIGNGSSIEI